MYCCRATQIELGGAGRTEETRGEKSERKLEAHSFTADRASEAVNASGKDALSCHYHVHTHVPVNIGVYGAIGSDQLFLL